LPVLAWLEGETCSSIALGLGIPVGTVYSRLFTARSALREAYEKAAPERRSVRSR